MANNLILPFAAGVGANILSDQAWAAYAGLAQGFQTGVAQSNAVNKALRQSTAVASGFGQFTADYSAIDFPDSLSPGAMRDNFRIALAAALDGTRMAADTSTTANTIIIAFTPMPTTLAGLKVIWFRPAATNTGASTIQVTNGTLNLGTLPLKREDGANPTAGDLVAGTWYPATCDGSKFSLIGVTRSEIAAQIASASAGTANAGFIGFTQEIVYGTAGTYAWTVPANVTAAWIWVWGAGGGGGSVSSPIQGGGGGGAGGFSRKLVTGLTPGSTITVTVGAGGAGSTAQAGGGGTSSFGSYLSATGGTGGDYQNTAGAGAPGGSGSGGTLNLTGGFGGQGNNQQGGAGGPAPGGGGGSTSYYTTGNAPGGGGAGAQQSGYAGYAGAPGMVLIFC